MTVQELIDALALIEDKSIPVILAEDAEGNRFNPAACHELSWYDAADGECYTDDDIEHGGYDLSDNATRALLIWP